MLLESSHTSCPLLNGVKLDLVLFAIRCLASSCAASASSLSFIKFFNRSSTAGNCVFSNESGTAIGVVPVVNSNGDLCLSECLRLLWVNSRVGSAFFHVVGLLKQYIERYASISWLNHSVVPSVCG